MVRVGIVGLGFMGKTHYEAYEKIGGARVVAIADADAKRAGGDLSGVWGNIGKGRPAQLPMDRIKGMTDYREMLAMDEVDVVDICLPTPAHKEAAIAALTSGKHVLIEKPLARTSGDAQQIADAAANAEGLFMPAMCMRFWPQWAWLKQAVSDGRYGKVLAATFRRMASMPPGWFHNGQMSGGALLDVHIHDTDFVYYLFGKPNAVSSRGYSKTTSEIDHVLTQYIYDEVPVVYAEGGWCLSDGSGFTMRYTVNFENATADFDISRPDPLIVSRNGKRESIACDGGDGYLNELRYFVSCVQDNHKPNTVTAQDAVESIRIVEAEGASIPSGRPVTL